MSREAVVALLGRGPAVVVTGAVTLLLVMWAAGAPRAAAPITLATPRPSASRNPGQLDEQLIPPSELRAEKFFGDRSESGLLAVILGWGAVALVVLGLAALLALLLRRLLAAWRERTVLPDDDTGPDLDRVARAVATDAGGRLVVLAEGTPSEGIVAAWTRLEETLRGAGLPLPASRTSTETAVAALARYGVDPESLHTLAALYREAGWSGHRMTEADRDRAQSCLRTLAQTVRAAPEPVGRRG